MKNFDAFKMGFWGTFGRTAAKMLIVAVGGKIIFSSAKRAIKKNGDVLIKTAAETAKKAFREGLENLNEEELNQLKNILVKMESKPEPEEEK